jgi:hypothetical protein
LEAEGRGSRVQGHARLHSETLSKKKKKKKKERKEKTAGIKSKNSG